VGGIVQSRNQASSYTGTGTDTQAWTWTRDIWTCPRLSPTKPRILILQGFRICNHSTRTCWPPKNAQTPSRPLAGCCPSRFFAGRVRCDRVMGSLSHRALQLWALASDGLSRTGLRGFWLVIVFPRVFWRFVPWSIVPSSHTHLRELVLVSMASVWSAFLSPFVIKTTLTCSTVLPCFLCR
jgi:hypothetical protein